MPKKVLREPRELGCPVSEFVRISAREPSREASRAYFRTIGQFGSARLSVGQAKNFWPRLGRRSDRGRNFVRMPTPAPNRPARSSDFRTCQLAKWPPIGQKVPIGLNWQIGRIGRPIGQFGQNEPFFWENLRTFISFYWIFGLSHWNMKCKMTNS